MAGLLLAAGAARRFGGPKLTESVGGRPIVRRSADALVHPEVGEILVVVPPDFDGIREALAPVAVRYVVNAEPGRGMARSIAVGVAAVSELTQAVLITLADQPGIKAEWISAVVARYREGDVDIVAPTFQGTPGHPVLFDRTVFRELAQLDGDLGARDVVMREPSRLAIIELGDPPAIDVDTPDDLARLRGEGR